MTTPKKLERIEGYDIVLLRSVLGSDVVRGRDRNRRNIAGSPEHRSDCYIMFWANYFLRLLLNG